MENDIFNIRNPMVIDGIPSLTYSESLVPSNSLDLNHQNEIMPGFPIFPTFQGQPIDDLSILNRDMVVDPETMVSRNTILGRNVSEIHEQFSEGTPISATSLATLLAARSCLHENINNISTFPSEEVLQAFASNDCSNTSGSSLSASANCGYGGVFGNMNGKWDLDKFLAPQVRTGFGTLAPGEWISSNNPDGSSKFSNELSLSLATSKFIPDQCSETGLGSEQTTCTSRELSLSYGSYSRPHVLLGSRYLRVVQEILAEIASYSLENLDLTCYSSGNGNGNLENSPLSSSFRAESGVSMMGSDGFHDAGPVEPILQRRVVEAKKTQLLALLQVVDDRYTQCLDEIHTVTSAFHAATELDPQTHTRFALQTVSFLYKDLRERISNQILAMSADFLSRRDREKEKSCETPFIQKQWALQQLRRKDHHLWRPQRGLPERSVSVLRAWMFQNFLHPYPKDAEKHLLAVKSGLTRSQVSNWFINARVRLWKPMIEEMYAEMNNRKNRRIEGFEGGNRRNHLTIEDQRYRMN